MTAHPDLDLHDDDVGAIEDFLTSARAYQELLERGSSYDLREFLRRIQASLLSLYAGAILLPEVTPTNDGGDFPDSSGRAASAVPTFHPELTDTRAIYAHVFDPYEDMESRDAVVSDLRLDLHEINMDLDRGLATWRSTARYGTRNVAWVLREDFSKHWGRHAAAAIAAIHSLLFDYHLEE